MSNRKKILLTAVLCTGTLLFTGCGGSSSSDLLSNVNNALDDVTYVESTISLNIQGETTGSNNDHSAGVLTEMKVHTAQNPDLAIYSESVSRITVDDKMTREYKEVYMVPDPETKEYIEYSHEENEEDWEKSTLSESEIMLLPIKSALLRDYTSLLQNMAMNQETVLIGDRENYMFKGTASPKILEDIFAINIYGTFMTNVEALLSKDMECTLYIDTETFLPTQLDLDFRNSFQPTDMSFDNATISVAYSNYNAEDGIEVPSKVSFTALDTDAQFYDTYYAWNLFLPYVDGEQMTEADKQDSSVGTFKSDWTSFQVRLDDGVTSLPIKYDDLKKLGYAIEGSDTKTLVEPNQYLEGIKVKKGSDVMLCTFYNDTTAALPLPECKIGAIDLSISNAPNNGIKLYLPGEVTLSMDKKSLVAAYGEPNKTEQSFAADKLTWYGEDEENQVFEAEISSSNSKVIRLMLKNIPVTGGNQTK